MKPLTTHPFAHLLPLMSDGEYAALRSDIAANGQAEDIVLFQGSILDGRNRYRVAEELKLTPKVRTFKGSPAEALQFVYSRAVHRNMTKGQKACAAVGFLDQFDEAAKARRRQNGGDRRSERGKISEPIDGKGRSRDQAGGLFGVDGTYVAAARQLKREFPEGFKRAFTGEWNIPRARNQMAKQHRLRHIKKLSSRAKLSMSDCDLRIGDNMTVMAKMPSRSVDLIFTDPPYNNGWTYDADPTGDDLPPEEFLAGIEAVLRECHRLLSDRGSIFVMIDGEYAGRFDGLLRRIGFYRRNTIYWWEHFPNHTAGNFSNAVRQIHYFTKHPKQFVWHGHDVLVPSRRNALGDKRGDADGKVPDNVWPIPRIPGNAAARIPFDDAPPQVPSDIPARIVRVASDPASIVMDPYHGNGMTAIAAVTEGRRYIGIERSKLYADQSLTLIKAAVAAGSGK